MRDLSTGSARMEPTEETTVRVYIEYADGENHTLFLEPGNSLALADDGPVLVETSAMTERQRKA